MFLKRKNSKIVFEWGILQLGYIQYLFNQLRSVEMLVPFIPLYLNIVVGKEPAFGFEISILEPSRPRTVAQWLERWTTVVIQRSRVRIQTRSEWWFFALPVWKNSEWSNFIYQYIFLYEFSIIFIYIFIFNIYIKHELSYNYRLFWLVIFTKPQLLMKCWSAHNVKDSFCLRSWFLPTDASLLSRKGLRQRTNSDKHGNSDQRFSESYDHTGSTNWEILFAWFHEE